MATTKNHDNIMITFNKMSLIGMKRHIKNEAHIKIFCQNWQKQLQFFQHQFYVEKKNET